MHHNLTAAAARHGHIVLLFALFIAGCGFPADRKPIEPIYDKETGRLQVLRYDSNGDGHVDTVSYMDGARVLRIEIDTDGNGTTDRWEYYDAKQQLEKVGFSSAGDGTQDAWSYARPDGSIERIDMSLARDGRVTRREHYEQDQDTVVRAEEDGDGDGVFDKWETYEGGRLASLAFDTAHRGRPDRRLVYGADGGVHLEVDLAGDGTFVVQK